MTTNGAVNGVKNTNNAILVIAHNGQRGSVDLPREKTITIEEIKTGKLRGRKSAIVMDNYALQEVARDVLHRVKHVFDLLTGDNSND